MAAHGLTRDQLAAACDISRGDLELMVKDQMEVSAALVQKWAAIFDVSQCDIAQRCGVSTPVAVVQSDQERLRQLEARVLILENQILTLTRQPIAGSK